MKVILHLYRKEQRRYELLTYNWKTILQIVTQLHHSFHTESIIILTEPQYFEGLPEELKPLFLCKCIDRKQSHS